MNPSRHGGFDRVGATASPTSASRPEARAPRPDIDSRLDRGALAPLVRVSDSNSSGSVRFPGSGRPAGRDAAAVQVPEAPPASRSVAPPATAIESLLDGIESAFAMGPSPRSREAMRAEVPLVRTDGSIPRGRSRTASCARCCEYAVEQPWNGSRLLQRAGTGAGPSGTTTRRWAVAPPVSRRQMVGSTEASEGAEGAQSACAKADVADAPALTLGPSYWRSRSSWGPSRSHPQGS